MATITITNELKQQLNHIPVEGLALGEYVFPDFLIIGPQRTGTTWLHRVLSLHPEIYIPAAKELYYFSCLTNPTVNYNSDRLEWYTKQFQPTLISFVKKNILLLRNFKRLTAIDFNLSKHLKPTVKGEATASYAAMQESLIQDILTLNPRMKILMLLRNPVERAWSHAKKDIVQAKNKTVEQVPFDEFIDFYLNEYIFKCGQFSRIIEVWSSFVEKPNFFIGNFDDIKRNPQSLLKDLYAFLGVIQKLVIMYYFFC